MAKNETKYTPVYESTDLQTNDPRKVIAIQTVVASNDTITTNLLLKFTSDKKKDNAYIKALAFNLDNENMKSLIDALAQAQAEKNRQEKKNPKLSARIKETAKTEPVKEITGDEKIAILKSLGMDDKQIKALLAKGKAKAPKEAVEVEETEDDADIFTLNITKNTKKKVKK